MAGEKVLIVEDDEDLAMAMKVRLRASGYEVAWAADGLSAITIAQRFKPAVILLDVMLPGGDGIVTMERMRSILPIATIPIVVFTGVDPERNRKRAEEAGAEAFLQKPVDNDELVATIEQAIGRPRRAPDVGQPEPPPRKKVLIVEDDDDLLHALRVRIKSWGYEVSLAVDAFTAISRTQKDHPDVLLLDIGLPGGDAFTVVERLRSVIKGFNTPLVFLTGRDPMANRDRAMELGAIAFLQKPVDNEELLNALRKAVDEPAQGQKEDLGGDVTWC